MPFDTLTMTAVVQQLDEVLPGGQIQRIIQPSQHSAGIAIYNRGTLHWLVLSADARHARLHLTERKLAKAFPTPSPFIMTLRKYLEAGRVRGVTQVPYERIARIECSAGGSSFTIVVEVMGKHSNVVLLDQEEKILGALKIVSPRLSRVRPILPGHHYVPPPGRGRDEELFGAGERVDPLTDPEEFGRLLEGVDGQVAMENALGGLMVGASPALVREVLARATSSLSRPNGGTEAAATGIGRGQDLTVAQCDIERVVDAARHLFGLQVSGAWEPCAFEDERGRPDFAPYVPVTGTGVAPESSISAAIDAVAGGEETRDVLSTVRRTVVGEMERVRATVAGRLHSLEEGLASARDSDAVMERGQLVLAYGYSVEPRARELKLPDMGMTIALDPELTAAENAEKMFRRYRKLRDAQRRIPAMIETAKAELDRIDDLLAFARLADAEGDLHAIRRQVGNERGDVATPGKARKRSGPPRYKLAGWTAIAGRSAPENDEVTFKLAGRDDLWLHAHERRGAHVIVQGGARGLPDDVLLAAAELAAYLSEGREDSAVDVDAAAVRDVRKIPNAPPGRVTYRNSRTVRARPRLGNWTRSGSQEPEAAEDSHN